MASDATRSCVRHPNRVVPIGMHFVLKSGEDMRAQMKKHISTCGM